MFYLFPSIWLPYEAVFGSYPHLLIFLLIIIPTCNLTCVNTLSMLPVSIYSSLWSNTQLSQLKWKNLFGGHSSEVSSTAVVWAQHGRQLIPQWVRSRENVCTSWQVVPFILPVTSNSGMLLPNFWADFPTLANECWRSICRHI